MKSTKSIFVVALAALMLVAFTACNNTVPSVYNGVVSAEVQQVKGYFNGEEVAEDGFQIVVNYAEGEPRIIKGNRGTINLVDNIAKAAGGIEFNDFQQNPVAVVPTEVEYSVATSVTISGVEAYTVEEGWTPKAFDDALATAIPEELKNLAFTLSTGDFSSTYTIQNKVDDKDFDYQLYLYDEEGKLLGYNDVAEEGDVYTVTLHAYMINNVWTTLPEDLDTGMTISVVEKETPAPNPTKNDVTALRVKWAIDGIEVGSENSLTAYAGQKVTYTIVGVVGDKEVPLRKGAEADYVEKGSIPTTSPLTAANITDDAQPAYTATVEFISNEGAGNWEAGSVAPITLTLTVKDAIDPSNLTSPSFTYADKVIAGNAVTFDPAKFTATVKTFDGKDAKLVGTAIKDKDTYAASEVTAGNSIPVRIKWVTADDTYLHYEGYADVNVAVEAAPSV